MAGPGIEGTKRHALNVALNVVLVTPLDLDRAIF
jgi:hypothetical protein